jgi:hypothetical protein
MIALNKNSNETHLTPPPSSERTHLVRITEKMFASAMVVIQLLQNSRKAGGGSRDTDSFEALVRLFEILGTSNSMIMGVNIDSSSNRNTLPNFEW